MIILILAVFGLVLGSFVNAFVWRLHEQEAIWSRIAGLKPNKRNSKKITAFKRDLASRSISKGRSMCPQCQHVLSAWDLVPVFSWLYLHGKCRYCSRAISWQYPLVELLTAGLFVLSYVSWPQAFDAASIVALGFFLVFIAAFMALSVYDLRWYILPDRIVFPLIGLAVTDIVLVTILGHTLSHVWQPAAGALIIAGLFWALFQISKGTWIGGGDVKLAIVLGLLAGTPFKALLVLFFASFLGLIITLPLALHSGRNLKLKIPFGPFLLAATILVVLYGDAIIRWYNNLFQLT